MVDRAEPGIGQESSDSAKVEVPQVAETRSIPEISVPMLEVHAPHEALHTWKGFFIHIATIVVGLLLAAQGSSAPAALNLPYQWSGAFHWPPNGAWQVLRQNGALALMSHRALADYTYFYEGVTAFHEAAKALAIQVDVAGAIARRAPSGVLGAGDIKELIAATSECQGRLAYLTKILTIEEVGLRELRFASSH